MSVLPTHPLQPAKMKLHQPTCMSHSPCTCHGQKWWRTKEAIGILGIQEVSQRAPQETQFFSLVEGGWVFRIFVVASVFSSSYPSSQLGFTTYSQVPSVFPNNTSLYSITFALSYTLVTYKQPKRRIQTVQSLIFFFLMGHSMMPITEGKQKKLWGSPLLINMSHTILSVSEPWEDNKQYWKVVYIP